MRYFINTNAFQQNALTSVTIPNSVISIGAWAFYYNNLTFVSIKSGTSYDASGSYYSFPTTCTTENGCITIRP